jgi:hypothetical protein
MFMTVKLGNAVFTNQPATAKLSMGGHSTPTASLVAIFVQKLGFTDCTVTFTSAIEPPKQAERRSKEASASGFHQVKLQPT